MDSRAISRGDVSGPPLLVDVSAAVEKAVQALIELQQADGHWCFELEADATIPSEYVLLTHYLGEEPKPGLEGKIASYLRRIQESHGGWPLFHGGKLDVSASVKAYFALKMIGDPPDAPHMVRAREAILAAGGAARSNVFTRFLLALYGEAPWSSVPEMPVEIMLLPRSFPFHLSKISYWARTVLVPMLVLQALRPRARNRRGVGVRELFCVPPEEVTSWPKGEHRHGGWAVFFDAVDKVLRTLRPAFPARSRQVAIAKAVEFVDERLNGLSGLGAIFPAMANAAMMYDALGMPHTDSRYRLARESIDRLLVERADEAYCQPCLSPVWDTALSCHALLEVGSREARQQALRGLEWLRSRQVLDFAGDWAVQRPSVKPGGWAFQYANPHYPDLDDSAVIAMALHRWDRTSGEPARFAESVGRAREWIEGMQSRNGGWAAFDADNTYFYLNYIPFADHGALLDPPTADVSARCICLLGQLGDRPHDSPALKAGLAWLRSQQEKNGSWFGRWGVNYIYGTWSALDGLAATGATRETPEVARAVGWLLSIQNEDGGWGEGCESYRLDYAGHEPAPSTASQTAWALLGLMAAGASDEPAVAKGVGYLLRTQGEDGLWPEQRFTGTGFPRVFYLRYHGYGKYFPLLSLARYLNLIGERANRATSGV